MTRLPDLDVHGASDLRERLRHRTASQPDFWDFATTGARTGGHAYFQYPAMMVPELQGALLDDLIAVDPHVRQVYDPFVGSGTVLLEALYRGLSFHGTDINPMAILLCQVKAEPPQQLDALAALSDVLDRAKIIDPDPIDFFGRDKWFTPVVLGELQRIRAAVRGLDSLELRRFFWVCLAETIRLVSNSRTSTVKLHIYAPDALEARRPDARRMFREVTEANCRHVAQHWTRQADATGGTQDPVVTLLQGSVESVWVAPKQADALMTSPPYGDNTTTIPYGQHSYLPLQFIDPDDIPGGFDRSLIAHTHAIDARSLGGSLRAAEKSRAELNGRSAALENFLTKLQGRAPLEKKVLAFVRDYDRGLKAAYSNLRCGGYSFLTLGERRVGGEVMPLVQITRELLESHGQQYVDIVTRRLHRKRMANRNSEGSTMATETILVMQDHSFEPDDAEDRRSA